MLLDPDPPMMKLREQRSMEFDARDGKGPICVAPIGFGEVLSSEIAGLQSWLTQGLGQKLAEVHEKLLSDHLEAVLLCSAVPAAANTSSSSNSPAPVDSAPPPPLDVELPPSFVSRPPPPSSNRRRQPTLNVSLSLETSPGAPNSGAYLNQADVPLRLPKVEEIDEEAAVLQRPASPPDLDDTALSLDVGPSLRELRAASSRAEPPPGQPGPLQLPSGACGDGLPGRAPRRIAANPQSPKGSERFTSAMLEMSLEDGAIRPDYVLGSVWEEEWQKGLDEGRGQPHASDPDVDSDCSDISGIHGVTSPPWVKASRRNLMRNDTFIANSGGSLSERHAKKLTSSYVFLRMIMIAPFSKGRVAWDLFGACLIGYDMIMIPMQAFDFKGGFMTFMSWLTMMFWSVDLLSSFLTGTYNQAGNTIEMRPVVIAIQYIRTWFILDILAVLPDWLVVVIKVDKGGASRMAKALRVVRVLRVLRLLRLAKLRRIMQQIEMKLDNEYFQCYMSLAKLMLSVLLLNHIIACGWFTMSIIENEKGWVHKNGLDPTDATYCYLASMHWALSNFNGEVDITAFTTIERFFTVIVLYVGLLVFSYFISSITHLLLQIRQLSEDSVQKQWRLMRYLHDNNISVDLSLRVKLFIEKVTQTTHSQEDDVPLLTILPSGLRQQLDCEIKGSALCVHPLLHHLTFDRESTGTRMCQLLRHVSLHYGAALFYQEQTSNRLFLVTVGQLSYVKNLKAQIEAMKAGKNAFAGKQLLNTDWLTGGGSISMEAKSAIPPVCKQGEWLSEMGLWTRWSHKGDCHACTHCTVFSLASEDLASLLPLLVERAWHVAKHASNFVRYMNENSELMDDMSSLPGLGPTEGTNDLPQQPSYRRFRPVKLMKRALEHRRSHIAARTSCATPPTPPSPTHSGRKPLTMQEALCEAARDSLPSLESSYEEPRAPVQEAPSLEVGSSFQEMPSARIDHCKDAWMEPD